MVLKRSYRRRRDRYKGVECIHGYEWMAMALEGLRMGGGLLCLARSGGGDVETGAGPEAEPEPEAGPESVVGRRLLGPLARRLFGCTSSRPRFSRLALSMVWDLLGDGKPGSPAAGCSVDERVLVAVLRNERGGDP